jgi:hypothetical protein
VARGPLGVRQDCPVPDATDRGIQEHAYPSMP